VVRGGAGVYYELPLALARLAERSMLGPAGTGRFVINSSVVPNPIPGIPTVPVGTPLEFRNGPTQFVGGYALQLMPLVKRTIEQQFTTAGALGVQNLEVFKQGSGLMARDYTTPYSIHFSIGIQRELGLDFTLGADYVRRVSVHTTTGNVDLNRWGSAAGPVIRACNSLQALDPRAQCSTGQIDMQFSDGRARYDGLLAKLERRWAKRYEFRIAYALSRSLGMNGVIDNNNWFASYGPTDWDRRHNLTLSAVADLPKSFRLSLLSSFVSAPPFRAQLYGFDINGDGTIDDVVPGTGWNELGRGLSEDTFRRVVEQFNAGARGRQTPNGRPLPTIPLPRQISFGDSRISQDFRISRITRFAERWELMLFGEVFNALNIANLTGYGTNVLEPAAFGQPSNRATQVFGFGGPRAFQFGGRLSF
jgi:hypothetical protein